MNGMPLGMNVKVPGRDYDNLVYFFWIIFSLASFAILSLTLAKKFRLI
jgi:Mg2+ and Co2+ transporter CorA